MKKLRRKYGIINTYQFLVRSAVLDEKYEIKLGFLAKYALYLMDIDQT
jgi:hypothetical protein